MKYTAEEIRALANVFEHGPVFDMLNAYAGRIKADESARGRIDFKGMWNAMSDRATTNPPAQAAQVDALRWLAVSCDPHKLTGAFAVDHARRAFGMGPFKDDPSYATAEPVAQGEVEVCPTCGAPCEHYFHSLDSGDELHDYRHMAAQPRAVPDEMINEVITALGRHVGNYDLCQRLKAVLAAAPSPGESA